MVQNRSAGTAHFLFIFLVRVACLVGLLRLLRGLFSMLFAFCFKGLESRVAHLCPFTWRPRKDGTAIPSGKKTNRR